MNELTQQNQHLVVFNFNGEKKLRTEIDELGKIWFCAKDICDILGYVNDTDAINKHCKPDGVAKRDLIDTICDEPNCEKVATCGYPTETGYRNTCFDHSEFNLQTNKQ